MVNDLEDFDAVREISSILKSFSKEEQSRIVRWVCEKFGLPIQQQPHYPEITDDPTDLYQNPAVSLQVLEQVKNAIDKEDFNELRRFLVQFLKNGFGPGILVSASHLAANGDKMAADTIKNIIESDPDLNNELKEGSMSSLVQYYIITNTSNTGLREIGGMILDAAGNADSNSKKAFLYNQYGRLLFSADRLQQAKDYAEKALRLMPGDTSYMHNLSVLFESMGEMSRAAELCQQMLSLNTNDPDHLVHAVQVFAKTRDRTHAVEAYKKLTAIDAQRAKMLSRNSKLIRDYLK